MDISPYPFEKPFLNKRLWMRWGLVFLFWTGLGLFFTLQAVVTYASRGDPVNWMASAIFQMGRWYAWGLLVPLVLGLARHYPIRRTAWWRGVLLHVLASLVVAPVQVALALALRIGGFLLFGVLEVDQVATLLNNATLALVTGSFDGVVTYWLIVGAYYAFDYYRKYRVREVQASQLEAQLAQAQLRALKMQLHPHFLFNTLHGISALVQEDPEAAERMIARLSDLLRLTLENADTQEVSLKQEVAFLEQYLEIERMRFPDRLMVDMAVEPAVLDACVPNLILQPLVENAIRHGVAPRTTPGRISIAARSENTHLWIQVSDNGAGLSKAAFPVREGVGLTNTRARLAQLYGAAQDMELSQTAEGGLVVTLRLPLRSKETNAVERQRT